MFMTAQTFLEKSSNGFLSGDYLQTASRFFLILFCGVFMARCYARKYSSMLSSINL